MTDYPSQNMTAIPVSKSVNDIKNENSDLIIEEAPNDFKSSSEPNQNEVNN